MSSFQNTGIHKPKRCQLQAILIMEENLSLKLSLLAYQFQRTYKDRSTTSVVYFTGLGRFKSFIKFFFLHLCVRMCKNATVRVWQSVNTSSPSTMWVLRLNSGSQAWYLYTLRHPASSRVSLKTKQKKTNPHCMYLCATASQHACSGHDNLWASVLSSFHVGWRN